MNWDILVLFSLAAFLVVNIVGIVYFFGVSKY